MSLFSRYDKTKRPWVRTSGMYGHFPTFYKCRGRDEDFGEGYDGRYCSKPTRHINDVGYLKLITKRKTYTWWYMGNPYRDKRFEKGAGTDGRVS